MNYVGKYTGIEIYECALEDYLGLSAKERNRKDKIYMITEDRNAMLGGKLFGIINEKRKWLDEIKGGASYSVIYRSEINKRKAEMEYRAEFIVPEKAELLTGELHSDNL